MDKIHPKRAGLALGAGFALVYVGCAAVMLTAPREAAVRFFNSLTHGVDWGPIMRWDMPWWEALLGVVEVFILGWLLGAFVAVVYNTAGSGGRHDGA